MRLIQNRAGDALFVTMTSAFGREDTLCNADGSPVNLLRDFQGRPTDDQVAKHLDHLANVERNFLKMAMGVPINDR